MLVEMVYSIMPMETCMMVLGTIISAMDMVYIQTRKVQDMKDTGRMILNLDKVLKFGQREVSILVNTKMERNKDMELTHGQMAPFTKVTGLIIALMVSANTNGKMEENTMETGIITTCTVWVYISIPMELPMKDNTKRTKRLDMAFISGLMEENTKAGGIMVNNTVLEFTKTQAKER
jgi:hypothetical protein